MTKNVNITIDIKVARTMLTVAGFQTDEIKKATDDEIFARVLSMIECYGATSEVTVNPSPYTEAIDTVKRAIAKDHFWNDTKERES